MRISDWSSDVCSSDLSEETAMEMAAGVLSATYLAHLAISTTGIAGPDGGTPGKPVGMVCFGFARRTSQGVVTRAMTRIFEGDRNSGEPAQQGPRQPPLQGPAIPKALGMTLELFRSEERRVGKVCVSKCRIRWA